MKTRLQQCDAWLTSKSFIFRLIFLSTLAVTIVVYGALSFVTLQAIANLNAGNAFYPFTDFCRVMWEPGKMLREGYVAALYQGGWLYPPPMGLLAILVSLLPLKAGFWLWHILFFIIAAACLRRAGLPWWVIIAGLAGPAEFYNLLLGQTGALSGGVLVASLLLIERQPCLSGIFAGALCLKPQMGLLLPIPLVCKSWPKAMIAVAVTVLSVCVVATRLMGEQSWVSFMTISQTNGRAVLLTPFGQAFQFADFSVFMMARSFGATVTGAWLSQGFCAVIAVYLAFRVWMQNNIDPVIRAGVTICLWMLAVPYAFTYDLIGFSVVLMALARRAPCWHLPILLVLWVWLGLSRFITAETHLVLLPLAALICLTMTWSRLKSGQTSMNSGLEQMPKRTANEWLPPSA